MYILGIRVDEYSREEALDRVRFFLSSNSQYTLFTPNPEMLVAGKRDNAFRDVLNRGSLNICDGAGIAFVAHGALKRIPGIDFMTELCATAEEMGKRIFLLGTGDRTRIHKASEALQRRFPKLAIVGAHPGVSITIVKRDSGFVLRYDEDENQRILDEINGARPDILFVAFGHQKQERWIDENLARMPTVNIAMGVGGALDVISGTKKRAPRWMRQMGLEWLWRVILEPWRFGRIWNATVVFVWYVIST